MTKQEVVVGRIGKAHGIKGEVSVEPRTDEPERRFVVGAVLDATRPNGSDRQKLTIKSLRWHQDRLLIVFAEIPDRNAAEAARNLVLSVTVDPTELPEDPEEFYDHQLVGLAAYTTDGASVGVVSEVIHAGGQDLLSIKTGDGEVLVPFVAALVPVVDVAAGRLEIQDRPGLLTPLPDDEPGEGPEE
ncbi:MAG TPA: ribosome maturation factor RimM [Nocardioidaceae bacterium]|nr:ribosome maturation factor RimM [Nocardioidaceae bacterium]